MLGGVEYGIVVFDSIFYIHNVVVNNTYSKYTKMGGGI